MPAISVERRELLGEVSAQTRRVKLNPSAAINVARVHAGIVDEVRRIFEVERGARRGEERTAAEVRRLIELWGFSVECRNQQMEDNPVWQEHGSKGVSAGRFRASAPSFLKVIQTVLVRPEDRMVFQPGANSDQVEFIIVDPRLITDTLLENLGLSEFVPESDGSSQLEKLERRAEAIPHIKAMLKNLELARMEPNERAVEAGREFRLMRVNGGEHEGDIIGTRHVRSERRVLYRADLVNAELANLHAQAGYPREMKTLQFIELTLARIYDAFINRWDDVKRNIDELEVLKDALRRAVDLLENVEDKDKLDLLDAINAFVDLKDSRGRHNPVALKNSVSRARRILSERIAAIESISEYLAKDLVELRRLRLGQEEPMRSFVRQVDEWRDKLRILRSREKISSEDVSNLLKELPLLRRNFEAVSESAEEFAVKVRGDIDDIVLGLLRHQDADVLKMFEKINSMPLPAVPKELRLAFRDLRRTTPSPLFVDLEGTQKARTIANLRVQRDAVAKIDFNPYRLLAGEILKCLDQTLEALEGDDVDTESATRSFVSAYVLSKVVDAHREIIDIYTDLSLDPERQNPESLFERVGRIYTNLAARDLSPNVKTPEYDDIYVALYQLLAALESELANFIQSPESEEDDGGAEPSTVEGILRFIEERAPRLSGLAAGMRGAVDRLSRTVVGGMVNGVRKRLSAAMRLREGSGAEPILRPRRVYDLGRQRALYERLQILIKDFDFDDFFR